MVGDEGHQVELAEHADHRVALAHDDAVDAMAQHKDHRIVEVVIHRDRERLERGDFAHRKLPRRFRPEQGIPQVGRREDAKASAIPHQRVAQPAFRELVAQGNNIRVALDEERPAHENVANPRRHQRHELAALAKPRSGPPRFARVDLLRRVYRLLLRRLRTRL